MEKDILELISEAQICAWMLARLKRMRGSEIPANSIEVCAMYHEHYAR